MPVMRTTVQFNYPGGGAPGYNVFHARWGDAAGPDEGAAPLTDILRVFFNDLAASFPSGISIGTDGLWSGVGPDVGEVVDVAGWSTGGTGASDFLPPFVCVNHTWRTSLNTRRGRGRSFLGPISASSLGTNGELSTSALARHRDAAAALVASSQDVTNAALGVWSRTDGVLRDLVGASVGSDFASLTTRRD